MTEPAREQLLGYLLGALDDNEQADIENILNSDAELRRELAILNRSLAPLDAVPREFTPPPGLAARTCAFVAASTKSTAVLPPEETEDAQATPLLAPAVAAAAATTPDKHSAKMKPVDSACGGAGRVRWQDSIVAAGIMVAACGLLFPAILDSREHARLMQCQSNLHHIGTSLAEYSDTHGGNFPLVPEKGKLAAAGYYAPQLRESGYLPDVRQVICPGSDLADDDQFTVPYPEELQSTSCPQKLAEMKRRMGGSYGYTLGHMNNGRYHGTKNLHRENFAIMADAPSQDLPSHRSHNHGGNTQNVLFEDGHVESMPTAELMGLPDNVFTNDNGEVAAGLHPDDSVIGSSPSAPVFNASMQ
ncbi:MAG: DUF1559 domain-containing protein [Pirellulales bacterium]|nr:DUF1559 domain-containing protein [Pirellulales bacterium]